MDNHEMGCGYYSYKDCTCSAKQEAPKFTTPADCNKTDTVDCSTIDFSANLAVPIAPSVTETALHDPIVIDGMSPLEIAASELRKWSVSAPISTVTGSASEMSRLEWVDAPKTAKHLKFKKDDATFNGLPLEPPFTIKANCVKMNVSDFTLDVAKMHADIRKAGGTTATATSGLWPWSDDKLSKAVKEEQKTPIFIEVPNHLSPGIATEFATRIQERLPNYVVTVLAGGIKAVLPSTGESPKYTFTETLDGYSHSYTFATGAEMVAFLKENKMGLFKG